MEKLSNSSHFLDIGGLDSLRSRAQQDDKAALKEVAQQFEGIFVQMLMKSMRDANAVFESDNPMNSQYTKFYEQMHDQQMSVNLADKGMLGLADLMVQQLSPETSGYTPASVLRGGNNELQLGNIKTANQGVVPLSPAVTNTVSTASIENTTIPTGGLQTAIPELLSGKILPSSVKQVPVQFANPSDFIAKLTPYAESAAKKLGTKPELLIAQSALETGWGQKMVKSANGDVSNNLFNIKADKRWQGERTQVNTLEYEQGVAVKQRADFRVYDDIKQSFDDFVSFISQGERYQGALKQAGDPKQFIKALQQAGYATDPQYADKVIKVMKSISQELKASIVGVQP